MNGSVTLRKALRLEGFKIRGQGFYGIWALLTLAPLLWCVYSEMKSAGASGLVFSSPSVRCNVAILQDLQILSLFEPLSASLLISRMTEWEHRGRTFKMLLPAGQSITSLWDAKFLIVYGLLEITSLLCIGASVGWVCWTYRIALPWMVVIRSILCLSAANFVTLILAQIIAFICSNPLAVLIEGAAGSLVGLIAGLLPKVFAFILPWGLYVAGTPATVESLGRNADGQMLWYYFSVTPPLGVIFGIALLYLILGLTVRGHLNRKEW